jgi:hypothetical protein
MVVCQTDVQSCIRRRTSHYQRSEGTDGLPRITNILSIARQPQTNVTTGSVRLLQLDISKSRKLRLLNASISYTVGLNRAATFGIVVPNVT